MFHVFLSLSLIKKVGYKNPWIFFQFLSDLLQKKVHNPNQPQKRLGLIIPKGKKLRQSIQVKKVSHLSPTNPSYSFFKDSPVDPGGTVHSLRKHHTSPKVGRQFDGSHLRAMTAPNSPKTRLPFPTSNPKKNRIKKGNIGQIVCAFFSAKKLERRNHLPM